MHRERFYTLSASCPDRTGIVAKVSGFIAEHKGWILETALHAEPAVDADKRGRYFMRIEIRADSLPFMLTEFRERFRPHCRRTRDGLEDHRLGGEEARRGAGVQAGTLPLRPAGALAVEGARHRDPLRDLQPRDLPRLRRVARHSLPPCAGHCRQQGPGLCRSPAPVRGVHGDTMVLARYMQILSPELCAAHPGKIINIHHSFLPSFVGAKPYHQAYVKGVKLIGATCHYVTAELDQGPIIEQDVIRIDHSDSVEDMVRYGKDIEKAVLARGLRYHLEDRVLVHGNKTVVFR
jgi:formyltetrahydrofolate deformylase